MKVAVVGGGSFGTVIANIAAGNGYPVSFWMRSDSLAAAINRDHVNESYLPGYVLNERVVATHDMAAAVSGAQLIFVAVPSSSFRAVVSELVKSADPGAMFVSTTSGLLFVDESDTR